MRGRSWRVGLALALAVWAGVSTSAQGTTPASLTGVVRDGAGKAVAGAAVQVRNNAGGAPHRAVTDGTGAFSVPALAVGTYTVTVSLAGFTTAVVKSVKLVADTPGKVTVRLDRAGQAAPMSNAS
jgi:hypothetical protein